MPLVSSPGTKCQVSYWFEWWKVRRPASTFTLNDTSEAVRQKLMKLARNVPWVVLFQICSNRSDANQKSLFQIS